MNKKVILQIFLTFIFFVFLYPAVVNSSMTSTNYTIFADAVGFGGDLSSSTSYTLQDTVGELAVGSTTSTSYTIRGGFQASDRGMISLTILSSSLSFGTLSVSSVATVSTTASVAVGSETGYSLSISSQSGTMWTTLTGTVDAGSEEFGVLVTGTDRAFSDTAALSSSLVLASNSNSLNETRSTDVAFEAAISSATTPGSYSKSITLTASANP